MNRVDLYRAAKSPVAPFVRRHWRSPVFQAMAAAAHRYLRIHGNDIHDMGDNGEAACLRRLPVGSLQVVFDVGGYHGEWTDAVLTNHPDAAVHCFEAAPATSAALIQKFAGDRRVRVNQVAVGATDGELPLFMASDDPSLNSLVRDPGATVTEQRVPVVRGDSYLLDHGIEHIDLLKIDTEGYDFHVLSSFEQALTSQAVSVIQFEYNRWNITSRILLRDFHDLLGPLGYRIGKVRSTGVDFKDYDALDEDWMGPACIAVHRSRPDLLAALAG